MCDERVMGDEAVMCDEAAMGVAACPVPPRDQCGYWGCYCEENVWKLIEHARGRRRTLRGLYAVFISNDARTVPLWKQKCKQGTDEPVLWDYHVLLLLQHAEDGSSSNSSSSSSSFVYDLDSTLPFPCTLDSYAAQALRPDRDLKRRYRRRLRVVPADTFMRTFASDRSHMQDELGQWRAPPPPHPCIRTEGCVMNLDDFVSMDPAVGCGEVLALEDFVERFRKPAPSPPPRPSSEPR
ncbi:protein N-terminal glutamine amidohydrolase [Petromyzon marinus]|uniref:protein N-terminal glutamine amidohydrolase n=1 Tax=Petromyzon marinus TaxID=7757 RepID=UPI003F70174D